MSFSLAFHRLDVSANCFPSLFSHRAYAPMVTRKFPYELLFLLCSEALYAVSVFGEKAITSSKDTLRHSLSALLLGTGCVYQHTVRCCSRSVGDRTPSLYSVLLLPRVHDHVLLLLLGEARLTEFPPLGS